MPITPDTKNWTWVLEKPCDECGFDADTITGREVAAMVRDNAARWPEILQRADATVRPNDDTWSPLEYGCHVRDVYRLFRTRLQLMLDQDDPVYPNWNQDETAVADRYNEQDPTTVGGEIVEAGEALAALLDSVREEDWSRTGRRSDGASFTIDSFAKYLLHDSVHHLWDERAEE